MQNHKVSRMSRVRQRKSDLQNYEKYRFAAEQPRKFRGTGRISESQRIRCTPVRLNSHTLRVRAEPRAEKKAGMRRCGPWAWPRGSCRVAAGCGLRANKKSRLVSCRAGMASAETSLDFYLAQAEKYPGLSPDSRAAGGRGEPIRDSV